MKQAIIDVHGKKETAMGIWLLLFVTNLLLPLILIGFGYYFRKNSPKEINSLFGYRTRRSMQNIMTWEFAHHYCGKVWVRWGFVMLVITIIAMLLLIGRSKDFIGIAGTILIGLQTVSLLLSIIPTERALKRTFDDDGVRRDRTQDPNADL